MTAESSPTGAHESVLVEAVLDALAPRPGGLYVDGTLGLGGHAAHLLARAEGTRLVGVDRDPDSLAIAAARLAPFGDRAILVHGEAADLPAILAARGLERVDGLLLDLGVSSPQLDRAERGFSFQRPGPVDMRMDPTRGPTALDLVRDTEVEVLGQLICDLGEERYGKRVARAIKDAVDAGKVATTTDLAAVIAAAIPMASQRTSRIHPATRTFQALRIAVNDELGQLATILARFPDLLAPGGRCAIISFHSLEDRLVKNRFRDLAWTSSLPPQLAVRAGERVEPVCIPVTRKAVFATDEEIERNPRARSARLRACERTAAPNVPSTR
ncbi:MAG: 16S rRNA (cytosine(1402)-N(4))-methyltransferase RsmH [Deltaproteobacteria bacterium]|nr:16S rRNA (cytosine(1402)-N(4))-methyltransferase RsmH [Deltaproteobacteria bacterium]